MKNTILNILATYGFETRADGSVWWGIGSLVWGHVAEVKPLGNDLYEVKYHTWFYDPDGNPAKDERATATLYGALMLQYLFERLPLFR